MIKVFIDTNILLDYYLNRDGADAAELLNTDTDDTVISKTFSRTYMRICTQSVS